MQIKLIDCNTRLLAIGIDMQPIGSGELLSIKLTEKFPYETWEYNYISDSLLLTVADGTIIPDMSEIGEVVPDDIGG